LKALCTRVIIIDHGKIVADDIPNKLSNTYNKNTSYKVEFKEKVSKKIMENIADVDKVVSLGKNQWILTSTSNKDLRENIFKFAVKNKFKCAFTFCWRAKNGRRIP